jgi:hypothetical protein
MQAEIKQWELHDNTAHCVLYDTLPSILHAKYFLEAMGYLIKDDIIYQDNMSNIQLERNGRASSLKQTRHIKIRYFFIKDDIERGEASVEHCPTKQMWADALTKYQAIAGVPILPHEEQADGLPHIYLLEEESTGAAALSTSLTIKAGAQHDVMLRWRMQ